MRKALLPSAAPQPAPTAQPPQPRPPCTTPQDIYSLGVLLWELYHGSPPWRALRRPTPPTTREREHALALEMEAAREEYKRRVARARANASRSGPLMAAASGCPTGPLDRDRDAKTRSRELAAAPPAKAPRPVEDGVWDDPQYRRRACDYLHVAHHCPQQYGRLIRKCLAADPARRPTAVHVMRVLLKMHRRLEAQAAGAGAGAGAAPTSQEGSMPGVVSGPPTGVLMALPRQRLQGEPGGADGKLSAAVLAELMEASAATNVTHGADAAAAAASVAAAAAAAVAPSAAAGVAAVAAASERMAGFLVMEERRSGAHRPPGTGEGLGGGGGGGPEALRVSGHHASRPNLLGTEGSVAAAVAASRGSAGRVEDSGWEAQEEEAGAGAGEAGAQQPAGGAGAGAGAGGSPPREQGGRAAAAMVMTLE